MSADGAIGVRHTGGAGDPAPPGAMPHLPHLPADSRQMPKGLDTTRAAPLDARRAMHLAQRLQNQAARYAGKAAANAHSASHWFWAGMAAQLAALVGVTSSCPRSRAAWTPGPVGVVALFTRVGEPPERRWEFHRIVP